MYTCVYGSFPELYVFVKDGELEATSPYAEKITIVPCKEEIHVICGRTPTVRTLDVVSNFFDTSVMKDNRIYSKTIWKEMR